MLMRLKYIVFFLLILQMPNRTRQCLINSWFSIHLVTEQSWHIFIYLVQRNKHDKDVGNSLPVKMGALTGHVHAIPTMIAVESGYGFEQAQHFGNLQ